MNKGNCGFLLSMCNCHDSVADNLYIGYRNYKPYQFFKVGEKICASPHPLTPYCYHHSQSKLIYAKNTWTLAVLLETGHVNKQSKEHIPCWCDEYSVQRLCDMAHVPVNNLLTRTQHIPEKYCEGLQNRVSSLIISHFVWQIIW